MAFVVRDGWRVSVATMSARLHGLNDVLRLRSIVRLDLQSRIRSRANKRSRRRKQRIQIRLLRNARIVEHEQQTRIVHPLDSEPATILIVFAKRLLDVTRLEGLGEAREGEDTRHAG